MGVAAAAGGRGGTYHRSVPRADRPTPPVIRRAASFAVASGVLATGAHALAGGGTADPLVVLIGVAAVGLLAAPALKHERRLPVIVAGLAGAQVGLHLWFAVTAASGGHHHEVATQPAGLLMLAAHGVATVAAAWWLRRGERRLWLAARRSAVALLLARGSARVRVIVPIPQAAAGVRPAWVNAPLCSDALLATAGTRGPPC